MATQQAWIWLVFGMALVAAGVILMGVVSRDRASAPVVPRERGQDRTGRPAVRPAR